MSKYIFVTGGVVSNLGKGITAASLGRLLVERGLRVSVQKLDPYINVDYGNMNPALNGEIFVTDDGAEVNLDIGHYERFLDKSFDKNSNFTIGKIYSNIISRERAGEYNGSTIQLIPHVTSEIKNMMRNASKDDIDVVIVDVGGVVGDMETMSFLEAIRQFQREIGTENYCHIHCTLVPNLESIDEVKTKPTQYSVKELMSMGISPNMIVCRTDKGIELTQQNRRKIAMFCNLDSVDNVIHNPDCDSIYEIPLILNKQGMDRTVCKILKLETRNINLSKWQEMMDIYLSDLPIVNIAIVGKYTEVMDSYLSITEAVNHAGFNNKYKAKISIISSEDIEMMGAKEILKNYDGVIVPGGFGSKGIEGKIITAEYCRENKVPYLGIGLGMEIAIIDFARNVANLKDANSTEFDKDTANPVIIEREALNGENSDNHSMRLGRYNVTLIENTYARRLYGMPNISERHRNMYEFNNSYKEEFERLGLVFSGINMENNWVEVVEYNDHPFFVACGYHPEFKTRPNKPHPLYVGFVNQAIANKKKN